MKKIVLPLFLFLFSLALYTLTLAPQVSPQGDSGELITVSSLLGIAHPPGYPLYTLLAHPFSYLPISVGSPASRINFFSALTHAATLSLFFLVVFKLTRNRFVAFAATLVLGFSYTFWLYSLLAEVFALNDLLVLAIIYLALSVTRGRLKIKIFAFLAFLFGLGLSNHHSIVLLLPALAFLLWPRLKTLILGRSLWEILRTLFILLLAFLLGLSPYLYILGRSKTAVIPVAWSYPSDFSSLLSLFLRQDYGTFLPYQGADPTLASLADKVNQIINYFRFLLDDFLWPSLLLFALGVVSGIKKDRRVTTSLLLGFVASLFFLTYANFPFSEFTGTTLTILERFYLLPNLFFALILGLGLKYAFALALKIPVLRLLPVPLVTLYLLILFFRNFPLVNQSDNFLAWRLARNILTSLPPRTILMPLGDVPTFLTMYVRYVEGFRPDVEIWSTNLGGKNNQYRYLRQVRPDLDLSLAKTASPAGFIEANIDKVPIATFGFPTFSTPDLLASPSGLAFFFQKKETAEDFSEWKKIIGNSLARYIFPTDEELTRPHPIGDRVVLGIYSSMFATLADFCKIHRDFSCAVDYLRQSLRFDPTVAATHFALAETFTQNNQCFEAISSFEKVLALNPQATLVYDRLGALAEDCDIAPEKKRFYQEEKKKFDLQRKGSLKNLE